MRLTINIKIYNEANNKYKDNEVNNVSEQKCIEAGTGIRYASYYRSEYGQIRRYSQHSTGWTTKDSRDKGLTSSPKLSDRFWSSQRFMLTEYREDGSLRTKRPGA